MATTTEAQKTRAIKDAVMELLDPDSSGNRTERSILETLYRVLTPEERTECLQEMASQGYNREEVANKMNDFEEDHFGTRGAHA
jgi:hypothetical protein